MSALSLRIILIYLIIACKWIVSKQLSVPELGPNSIKINECQRCKVLVDSFNHGIERTSRGKFEGGDADWEETKLRSYSRSEVRLVEIQENLCTEVKKHQDHCYSIAEEAEQALEKWWFHEDPNTIDLYTWLCIETLQTCCPQNHYGNTCEPCLLDKHTKVCGGRGKCDGEGTRKGTGTCVCHKGYTGNLCNECAKNFYNDIGSNKCKPCHKACDGCSGEGNSACHTCNPGWSLDSSNYCIDINECLDPHSCDPHQYCINEEGSHVCKACDMSCVTCSGPGTFNCTSCEPGFVLWSGMCTNKKVRKELLLEMFRRIALYFGLLLITVFVFRKSRTLSSLAVSVISVYIFISEKTSGMSLFEIISNIYF